MKTRYTKTDLRKFLEERNYPKVKVKLENGKIENWNISPGYKIENNFVELWGNNAQTIQCTIKTLMFCLENDKPVIF